MALVWVATAPIRLAGVLAYTPNYIVPASAVAAFNLDTKGLVVQREVDDAESPSSGGIIPVLSVNGKTGPTVVLTASDLGVSGGGGGPTPNVPLFNVEDPQYAGGAKGDNVTDDYPAIKAAWDAMLASSTGGVLFFPRPATYRVVATSARLTPTSDGARALFPLPMVPRSGVKRLRGVLGVGDPYVIRTADLGGTPGQVQTATVLRVDYSTPFSWSETAGLPCVFGGPDADMGDSEGNTFSNLHFSVDGLIVRQPANPSLTCFNLEQLSTVRIRSLRCDVVPVLDAVPEPTHPTAAGVLLSRSNNNIAVSVDRVVVEGYFAGVSLGEHCEITSAIVLRCRIGIFTRRLCSHAGTARHLKVEQCPWGFAGWDPTAATAAEGVVAWRGWTGRIEFLDVEDYAYNGAVPWIYAPTAGAHIYDPLGRFNGTIAFVYRINSEPSAAPGIGIGPEGGSQSLYVIGPSGTNSPIAIYGINHTVAATRLAVTDPGDGGTGGTIHRLFADNPVGAPTSSATDGSTLTLGVRVDVTAACSATGIRFWRPDLALTGTMTGRIYRMSDQAVVAGPVTFTLSGTGWQVATLTTPVALEAGQRYVVAVTFPDRYPFTASYWDSGPGNGGIIAGPLTAYSTNDSAGGQGALAAGESYPASSGNGANYWVDVVVTTD